MSRWRGSWGQGGGGYFRFWGGHRQRGRYWSFRGVWGFFSGLSKSWSYFKYFLYKLKSIRKEIKIYLINHNIDQHNINQLPPHPPHFPLSPPPPRSSSSPLSPSLIYRKSSQTSPNTGNCLFCCLFLLLSSHLFYLSSSPCSSTSSTLFSSPIQAHLSSKFFTGTCQLLGKCDCYNRVCITYFSWGKSSTVCFCRFPFLKSKPSRNSK